MVKSLEQYLSELNFNPVDNAANGKQLSPGERAFIEKYLGLDALATLPRIDPEPMLQEAQASPAPKLPLAEPEIKVAVPEIIIAPPAVEKKIASAELLAEPVQTHIHLVQEQTTPDAAQSKELVETETQLIVEELTPTVTSAPTSSIAESLTQNREIEAPPVIAPSSPPSVREEIKTVSEQPTKLSLKEMMRQQEEIQAVSFFVSGQLFLLPVAGIQEVLRHMELIRVPQAPDFVAGVINLRGKVTPLVHLAAVLTNDREYVYDPKKNFIIICGTEPLQVGLIIDRINSMHLLPQDKVIWNVEAKLGEAADFLYAIVNLDEKVCGMVAPEMITKRILSPDT